MDEVLFDGGLLDSGGKGGDPLQDGGARSGEEGSVGVEDCSTTCEVEVRSLADSVGFP